MAGPGYVAGGEGVCLMARAPIAIPQRVQKRVPGRKGAPQLAQNWGVAFGGVACCDAGPEGVAGAAKGLPHCLQFRAPTRFSVPQ